MLVTCWNMLECFVIEKCLKHAQEAVLIHILLLNLTFQTLVSPQIRF